jgi:hypothetical protein
MSGKPRIAGQMGGGAGAYSPPHGAADRQGNRLRVHTPAQNVHKWHINILNYNL